MRLHVKMPSANSVAAGQTATFNLPIGRRYHDLRFALTNITAAQVDMLRIKVNGESIITCTGAELDSINQFDGRAAAAGLLSVGFDRFSLYSQQGEEITALQTGSADPKTGVSITQFSAELDINAAVVNPAISLTATQSDNDPKVPGPGLIRRLMRYSRTFSAAGIVELSDLPKGTEGPKFQIINRTVFKTAATNLEIERDNRKVFQRSKTVNDRIQADGVRVPQAGYFVYDPTEEGYDYEGVTLFDPAGRAYQDLRYLLELPAGETTIALVEYLGALQG